MTLAVAAVRSVLIACSVGCALLAEALKPAADPVAIWAAEVLAAAEQGDSS